MKKANDQEWYIVNITMANKMFYYNQGFDSEERAKEARDQSFDKEIETIIRKGEIVNLSPNVKTKKCRIRKYDPDTNRKKNGSILYVKQKAQKRLIGIQTHLFSKVYNPLPEDAKGRKKQRLKGRDKIRNQILKRENLC